MCLLLLKLQAVGLDFKLGYILGKTVQDMVLDSYLRQILVVRWLRSDVFNIVFEISKHLFLVFLLLTLNIVFFFAKYVVRKVTSLQPIVLQKRQSTWNFSRDFQQSQIERVWMLFKSNNNKLHHWHLRSASIKL